MIDITKIDLASEEWIEAVSDVMLRREGHDEYINVLLCQLSFTHAMYTCTWGFLGLN